VKRDPFRDMPFPSSGAHAWRVESGALVPDVPAAPAKQALPAPAVSAPLRMPRKPTKSAAAPRRNARTRKE
jgi:hypothetical protein